MGKIKTRRCLNLNRNYLLASTSSVEDDSHLHQSRSKFDEIQEETLLLLADPRSSEKEAGALMFANFIHSNLESVNNYLESVTPNESIGTQKLVRTKLGDVLRLLAPLLCEQDMKLQMATAEALSHLSLLACDSITQLMIDSDVLTPVLASIECLVNGCVIEASSPKATVFCYLCDVLTELCSHHLKAVTVVCNSHIGLVNILKNNVRSYQNNLKVAVASAELLAVLSEDKEFISPDCLLEVEHQLLLMAKLPELSPRQILLLLYLCAIAVNVGHSISHLELMHVLKLPLQNNLAPQFTKLPLLIEKYMEMEGYTEHKQTEEKLMTIFNEAHDLINAKIIALESFNNILVGDDWTDLMDAEFDDDDLEDDVNDGDRFVKDIDVEMEEFLCNSGFIDVILKQIEITDTFSPAAIGMVNVGKYLVQQFERLTKIVFLTIGNVCDMVSVEKVFSRPNELFQTISKYLFLNDCCFSKEAVSAMRALACSDCVKLELNESDLHLLYKFYQERCNDSISKINTVKLLVNFSLKIHSGDTGAQILSQVLQLYRSESSVELRAEILDSIIDGLADDDNNVEFFRHSNFLAELNEVGLSFRKDAKKHRHVPVVDTVYRNILRFINYKQKLIKDKQ